MKKLVFTLMVAMFATAGLMAQNAEKKASCSKEKAACCASKAKTASTTTTMNAKVLSMAKSIAEKDENI